MTTKTFFSILLLSAVIFVFSACNDVVEPAVPSIPYVPASLDGIEIAGIRWATRNVDAPGTFAESPESAGMFYQWNRRVGWSATNPLINSNGGTTWNTSIPDGTKWERENDPCPEGWRVPTQQELQSLNNLGSIWGMYNGVRGRLFGTAPNQIFLPAVGFRLGSNGAFSNSEFHDGSIWAVEQYTHERAMHLWFTNGYSRVVTFWRAAGLSVRCVAK